MLLIDRTFETIDEDSAEAGEAKENGFRAVNEPVTFRELVDLIKAHPHASQSPANPSPWVWFTTEAEQDYRTGEWTSESIHYSRDNPDRCAKYWAWAMRAAGVRLGA